MEKRLSTKVIGNAEELIHAIERASRHAAPDLINVTNANGDYVRIVVIEETLSDGSKVYNIEVS